MVLGLDTSYFSLYCKCKIKNSSIIYLNLCREAINCFDYFLCSHDNTILNLLFLRNGRQKNYALSPGVKEGKNIKRILPGMVPYWCWQLVVQTLHMYSSSLRGYLSPPGHRCYAWWHWPELPRKFWGLVAWQWRRVEGEKVGVRVRMKDWRESRVGQAPRTALAVLLYCFHSQFSSGQC